MNIQSNNKNQYQYCDKLFSNFGFLFSRITDITDLPGSRKRFLDQLCQSLNLSEHDDYSVKLSNRLASKFGSFEFRIFNRILSSLHGIGLEFQHEVNYIVNKCSKDPNWLYDLDAFIKKHHSSVKLNTLIRLINIYNGDLGAIESLLNSQQLEKIENILNSSLFHQIESLESKRNLFKAGINIEAISTFHFNLMCRCSSTRWNESNFYQFLFFLSENQTWKFFALDPSIQGKIQNLFLNLSSHHNSLSTLINNESFLNLASSTQFKVLHCFQKDPTQCTTLLELISDKQFCALRSNAQEGVFNVIKLISWSGLKNKCTQEQLQSLATSFKNSNIEMPNNRALFQKLLDAFNLEDIKTLIKEDSIQSFQKKVLPNALAILTELKQYHLKKQPQQQNPSDYPYTLTESQMKLYLRNNFQERDKFNDDASWIKSNLDVFVEKVLSRKDILKELLYLLPAILVIFKPDTFFSTLISIFLVSLSMFGFSISISLPFFIERRFGTLKNELLKILMQENAHQDRIVFYHGADGNRGALYEMYTQFRFAFMMATSLNENAITTLREFDDLFDENLTTESFKIDIENRWKKMPQQPSWYDEPNYYASRAISTSPGLFSNLVDIGECTLHYWQYSCSINSIDNISVLKNILSRLYGNGICANDLNTRAKSYNDLINKIAKLSGGTLLQILIGKTSVDEIAFVTEAGGLPLNIQLSEEGGNEESKTDKPGILLSLQRQSPDEYERILKNNKINFKKTKHLRKNNFNYFATQQARIIPHPKILADPEKTTINKYDAAIPQTDNSAKTIQKRKELELLRKQLKAMIQEDVLRSAANGNQLEAGSIAGYKGLLPIQRYFQYVVKGVFNEEVEFKTAAEKKVQAQTIQVEKIISDLGPLKESKFSPSKLGYSLMTEDYDPKNMVKVLKNYPELKTLMNEYASIFGSQKESHIEKLLESFEKQVGALDLKQFKMNKIEQIDFRRLMRLILVFQGLNLPTEKMIPFCTSCMAKMGFSKKDILLSTNLLSCNIFRDYIFIAPEKLQQSRAKTKEVLAIHAKQSGTAFAHYFVLQYLLHTSQVMVRSEARFYKPDPELNGLMLSDAQPDLKIWISEI